MIRIALLSPYQKLSDLFSATLAEHNRQVQKQPYETDEYQLEIIPAIDAKDLEGLSLDADVIVARGFMAATLQERGYYIPVVELPVAINDLIRCIHRVRDLVESPRVAVIGSYNMTMGVEQLSEIFKLPVCPFTIQSRQEIEAQVELAATTGFNVVVGGIQTCEEARRRNLAAVFLESSRESIWYAITEAKRVAYISRREKEKSQNLSLILNQSSEGIIALNAQGRITLINTVAEQLLRTARDNALGKTLGEIITTPRLLSLLEVRERTSTEVAKHGEFYLAITKAPIEVQGENLGTLITVQDVTSIQRLEAKIREKIHTRGLIARHTFEDIIGESLRIKQVIQMAKNFSRVDSHILVVGKTGTGKELFAQSIHNYSPRSKGPFVAINCAALSESLLESELFGYTAGAFTGAAREGKPGLFELAHRGTIFLDEISEISPRLQILLLRVLQEKEIMRLGDNRVVPVDVRVIASANRDLFELVQTGRFREDLFYRLDILRLHLPALEERQEDIPLIAVHWINQYSTQFAQEPRLITDRAKQLLREHPWPGNIRQLRNLCERMVVLSQVPIIDQKDVEIALAKANHLQAHAGPSASLDGTINSPLIGSATCGVEDEERQKILSALRAVRFSKKRAAESLGMNRTTLWRKMKNLGIPKWQ